MIIHKRKNSPNRNRWMWLLVPLFALVLVGIWVFTSPLQPNRINFLPTLQPSPTTGPMLSLRSTRVKLDVAFVFDTTGSMGDELAQLQSNVLNIAGEIAQWGNNVDIQYGLVAYKDRGDTYVTQVYAFTNSATQFQANLMKLSAEGGGDTPEDLAAGLEATLHQLQWRGSTDAIQLVFVVTDASAKLYGGFTYMDSIEEAAQRGIKIHSLAASGLDDTGEFMLRQASQMTMGRFIFLTYDGAAPNPGSDRRDLDVGEAKDATGRGEYEVEQLPQLVIRLIREELEYTMLVRR
jgi:hypothetical protein